MSETWISQSETTWESQTPGARTWNIPVGVYLYLHLNYIDIYYAFIDVAYQSESDSIGGFNWIISRSQICLRQLNLHSHFKGCFDFWEVINSVLWEHLRTAREWNHFATHFFDSVWLLTMLHPLFLTEVPRLAVVAGTVGVTIPGQRSIVFCWMTNVLEGTSYQAA